MATRTYDDDWGGGVGSSGGSPVSSSKKWLYVMWDHDSRVEPMYFEVVAYNGATPEDSTKWLFQPIRVPGTVREAVKAFTPTSSISGINVAVRAVYA